MPTYTYSGELESKIQLAAELAYANVLEEEFGMRGYDRSTIARAPACLYLSDAVRYELEEKGVIAGVDVRHGLRVNMHRYLRIATDLGELIIDPSWKQFAPDGPIHPDFPDVAVSTRTGMISMARRTGISAEDRQLWAPKGMYEEPDNRPVHERIAAAIDSV